MLITVVVGFVLSVTLLTYVFMMYSMLGTNIIILLLIMILYFVILTCIFYCCKLVRLPSVIKGYLLTYFKSIQGTLLSQQSSTTYKILKHNRLLSTEEKEITSHCQYLLLMSTTYQRDYQSLSVIITNQYYLSKRLLVTVSTYY
jgi:hypothetical protein